MVETFPIIPAHVRTVWSIIPIGVLVLTLIGVTALLAKSFSGARNARFDVSAEGLRLRGDMYGRLIPAAHLRVAEARAVDLATERALQPTLRTMGTAVGGYSAGWFRLRDGERALLYVTDRHHVAYVPTTQGYSVLVSVADPAAFIASLQRAVTAASVR